MHSQIEQNFPIPQASDGWEPANLNNCPEINFSDIDPCHVPCPLPQNCPTPLQGQVHGLDACGPVHPLPVTPTQPSTFPREGQPFPVETAPSPLMEQATNLGNTNNPDSSSAESLRFENSEPIQVPAPEELNQWGPPKLNDSNDGQPSFMDQPEVDESLADNKTLFENDPLSGGELSQNSDLRKFEDPQQNAGSVVFDNAAFQMFSERQSVDSGEVEDRSNQEDHTGGIIIHPPMIQPYHRNQHTFVVENQGLADAKDIVVELTVPDDVRILATLPAESVNSTHRAVFRFDSLPSGDRMPIHVTAISNSKTPIPFEANVTSRSVYSFDVQGRGHSGVLKNASYSRNAVSVINQSEAHLIPAEDTFTDPVLVRNPYYQTILRDQKASLPANLR